MADERHTEDSRKVTLERVRAALSQVKYGEIRIKVEGGKPISVETVKRERVG